MSESPTLTISEKQEQKLKFRESFDTFAQLQKAGLDSVWINQNSLIRLITWNSHTPAPRVDLHYRILELNGTVSDHVIIHTPNTDRTTAVSTVQPTNGYLLSVHVVADVDVKHGELYARVDIQNVETNTFPAMLCQGYTSGGAVLIYPNNPNQVMVQGQGVIKHITGTDPAAGAEINEAVPTNARWELLGFRVVLVADANVANRALHLQTTDGTTVNRDLQWVTNQTAGQTVVYNADPSGALLADKGSNRFYPLPKGIILMEGWEVQTQTDNIQAGDNYGAPTLIVREWLED